MDYDFRKELLTVHKPNLRDYSRRQNEKEVMLADIVIRQYTATLLRTMTNMEHSESVQLFRFHF